MIDGVRIWKMAVKMRKEWEQELYWRQFIGLSNKVEEENEGGIKKGDSSNSGLRKCVDSVSFVQIRNTYKRLFSSMCVKG